ncbi:ABC transporter ATP-binding protein [Streptococcus gallolyticus]|uniref:ABC transporter ATP-binding protein n=1 Tax=Streptococcus gallolyticus TaxID=315405 RepID=UPI00088ECD78|nr:ATP-binding cassette domain-containing protein [Streptococcus gallolyticus]SDK08683.1 sulfonate transport system ATP-binding protein [Streptococcus gallolyticus]SDL57924.1 sulfonate transport system ATP-binding protein [Streptococcus gallolyticus]
MTDLITIDNVTKKYGDKTALANANLAIEKGDFVALVGMSGSGKTTLLRMVAGLEQPSQGTISQNGVLIRSLNEKARVMFQDDRLLPWMTVRENLSFGNKSDKMTKEADELLSLVGLSDFADYYPAHLSGGQKQRVALARALMYHPELLLLDEPLGALDALTRRKMQDLILDICQSRDFTTMLVTHDIDEAARMANKIVVVKHSTIVDIVYNPYRKDDSYEGKAKRAEIVDNILATIYAE